MKINLAEEKYIHSKQGGKSQFSAAVDNSQCHWREAAWKVASAVESLFQSVALLFTLLKIPESEENEEDILSFKKNERRRFQSYSLIV